MRCCRLGLLSIAFVSLSICAHPASALEQNDTEEAIKKFLDTQKSETEDAQAQGSVVADLDNDGKAEIVLVWTLLGPTYSHNTLTVLTKNAGGFKPAASFQLIGEAQLSSVKGGIIFVNQRVFAKNDPVCCRPLRNARSTVGWGRKYPK